MSYSVYTKMGKQECLFIAMLLPAMLVPTAVNCYPMSNADISLKSEFNTVVQKVLNTIKLQCGTKKMSWDQYCQDDSPLKCPPWDLVPLGNFYGQHCSLAYFDQEIKRWEEDTFDSPEHIEKQLNVTWETFPPIQCGNDGYSCPRDKQLCYRGGDTRGVCMEAKEGCSDDPTSPLCQNEAGIFIVKMELMKLIDEMKKKNPNLQSHADVNSYFDLKIEFNTEVQHILNSIKPQCGITTMSWNQYCQDDPPLNCPHPQELQGDFYGQHCPLAYLHQDIKRWQEDAFISPENIEKQFSVTMKTFPRVKCGNEGDSCPRDKELCYRGVGQSGMCMDAKEYCSNDPTSVLCQSQAGIFIAQTMIRKSIENMKANQSPIYKNLTTIAIVGIVLGCVAFVVIIIIVFIGIRRRKRRPKPIPETGDPSRSTDSDNRILTGEPQPTSLRPMDQMESTHPLLESSQETLLPDNLQTDDTPDSATRILDIQ